MKAYQHPKADIVHYEEEDWVVTSEIIDTSTDYPPYIETTTEGRYNRNLW